MKYISLEHTIWPYPTPDFIWKQLKQYSKKSNLYPSDEELLLLLSKRYSLEKNSIALTAGCDESLQLFSRLYGSQTFIFTPTYRAYNDADRYGGTVTHVGSLEFGNYDINYVNRPRATLFFLANPNNPVGLTPKETVMKLVINNPQAIIVVDETFADFAHQSVVGEVAHYKNLVVCRSFSYSHGLAGSRIGFFVAHPDIVSKVKSVINYQTVSVLSIGSAIIALSSEKYFYNLRQELTDRRDGLVSFLLKHDFPVIASHIPCVFIKYKNEKLGDQLFTFLHKNGILVQNGNAQCTIGLDYSGVRMGIGTEQEMLQVKKVLAKYVLKERKAA